MTRKHHDHLGRKTIAGALAIAAVSVVGMTAAHADQHPRRLHLIEREVVTDMTDIGAAGISPGDAFTVHSDMLDRNHQPVGRVDLYGIVTQFAGDEGSFAGTGIIHLQGGTISFASGGSEPEHVTAAITGGTGLYRGVRGELLVTETDDSPEANIDITLTS